MKKTFPVIVLFLFLSAGVVAETGQPTDRLFTPSSSAMGIFMSQLYERTSCHDWFGSHDNPNICSESVFYDSGENLIHIYFRVPSDYTWLENFTRLPLEARKKIFTDLLINTAVNMGVGVRDDMALNNTLIHSISMQGEFLSTGYSEEGFKREVAERIVVHLATVKENQSYQITRDHQGNIILGGEAFESLHEFVH